MKIEKMGICGLIVVLVLVIAVSGCTSSNNNSTNTQQSSNVQSGSVSSSSSSPTSQDTKTPVDGKYNQIKENVSGTVVWTTNICPMCGASDPELQAVTDKLESNKCQACGYKFYNLKTKYAP